MLVGFVGGLALSCLAWICLQFRRDFSHPAVLFPLVWGGTLLLVGFASLFGFFSVSATALLLFAVGTLLFALGALSLPSKGRKARELPNLNINYQRVFWFCAALHAMFVPLALREIREITEGSVDIFAMAYQLRAMATTGERKVGALVGNYLLSGLFFVPLLQIGWMKKQLSWWKVCTLAAPWILLNLLVAGRSGLVTLVLALAYI